MGLAVRVAPAVRAGLVDLAAAADLAAEDVAAVWAAVAARAAEMNNFNTNEYKKLPGLRGH